MVEDDPPTDPGSSAARGRSGLQSHGFGVWTGLVWSWSPRAKDVGEKAPVPLGAVRESRAPTPNFKFRLGALVGV